MSTATVLIVTKDRREELLRAVEGAVAQEGEPEVLVIDDASGDGSADAVEAAFPSVRVLRSERSEGAIAQRNTVGIIGLGVAVYSGLGWMGNLREALSEQWDQRGPHRRW